MHAETTISASEFKAKCLEILNQLSARKLTQVTITKRGRPVAVLTPPKEAGDEVRKLYGFMEGTVVGLDDVDLTEPILQDKFLAEDGILFSE
jgi:prevent-host-death family protein